MCGRFSLRKPAQELATFFDVAGIPDLTPRYNIAPTQMAAAVRMDDKNEKRELVLLHWGLIPSWSKDPSIGRLVIGRRCWIERSIAERTFHPIRHCCLSLREERFLR